MLIELPILVTLSHCHWDIKRILKCRETIKLLPDDDGCYLSEDDYTLTFCYWWSWHGYAAVVGGISWLMSIVTHYRMHLGIHSW